ncbi:hypothetical protein L3Y34_016620 [Caenorhabditis briggsae]|uniref:Uncharacterized protein n=1 Tax=Caenorhabditis briggsae TaxID=6238 RepID=A0AAE9J0T3_CAEBR|nr:hypothetical protein L3Y34_016620 [Caenorhabditis briggsae]
MCRSKRANRASATYSLKRTSYSYVKGAESEHVSRLAEWQRFCSHSNVFLEDVEQQYENCFCVGQTDLVYPCLVYNLHVQNPCYSYQEIWDAFEGILDTVEGIALLMKKHRVLKIILVTGKGRFVLKKELRLMFEDSTDFRLQSMKENAGRVLLKQKKKKTPAESSVFVNRFRRAEVNEVEEDAEDTVSITDSGYSGY